MINSIESSANLSQNAICIIPARGGSKRIPRKNIKNFCAKPMISYSIKAAKNSGLFSRVVVSSDDLEILEISQSFGAEALLRPKEISDDYANTRDVILHAISALQIPKNAFVCCIYATAPLLSANSLKKAWELREENCFVFGAAEFSSSPFRGFLIESNIESNLDSIESDIESGRDYPLSRIMTKSGEIMTKSGEIMTKSGEADSIKIDSIKTDSIETDSIKTDSIESKTDSIKKDSIESKTDLIEKDSIKTDSIESGADLIESKKDSIKKTPSPRARMLFKEHFLKRSQDLAKVYFDAAQFYLATALCWELRENLFEDSIPLVLPPSRVCDIDNISDWELAELKFKALKNLDSI